MRGPLFDKKWIQKDDTWVVECDLEDSAAGRHTYYPPRIKGQKSLLEEVTNGGWGAVSVAGECWRPFQDRICFQANMEANYVDLRLPSTEKVFERILKQHDYSIKRSDKADYIAASTTLLDQADFTKHLRETVYRDLFDAMKKGEALTKSAMLQYLKLPKKQQSGFPSVLLDLLRHGCLLRGSLCRCPACGMKNWYPVDEQDEFVACTGCRNRFQFPLDCAHSYRLSSLLSTCVDQGGIPVILTEMVLKNLAKKAYMAIPGLKLSPGEHDIDIAAVIDGRLVFAECKTMHSLKSPKNLKQIMAQLEKDHAMAKDIGADVFCVSVMTDKPYQSLLNFVKRKNKTHKPPLTIMLTLKDLEKGWLTTACVREKAPVNNRESRLWVNDMLELGYHNGFRCTMSA
ncbi:MAG TPA: hypothetical protein PLC40_17755 [Candidatus Hydrogenedentes bacterium]|nr:hypothetical protein [Candidatus Hydrogenedentota bacterium]